MFRGRKTTRESESQLNVAIVGGGLSGLTTAVYLSQHGHARVSVFEAAAYFGGQTAAWRDADGDPVETGIHLAFPWYHNLLQLYQDVGRPLRLVETDGNYHILDGLLQREELLIDGRSALATLRGLATFPGLTARERLKLAAHIWRILRMDDAAAESHDHESVSTFLQAEGASAAMMRKLSLASVTIQGLPPDQASATSYIKFLRTLYGSIGAFDTAFFDAPLDDALVLPLVDYVRRREGILRCNAPVARLDVEGGQVSALVLRAGERLPGFDAVVLALPGYLVPALLPAEWCRRDPFDRIARLTSAQVLTLTLWYSATVIGDGNVRISNREGVIFDAVADKAHHWADWSGGSVVQVLIDAADDLDSVSDDGIYQRVLDDLARFFPACATLRPHKWHILRHRDIYCATRPGYWALVPRTHETPIANLYLAGDYTDGPYHYGMESAVVSGKAVARLLLERSGRAPVPAAEVGVRYLPLVRAHHASNSASEKSTRRPQPMSKVG